MKNISTILGNVTVMNIQMQRASGYGQYTICIGIQFEGKDKIINVHSTDSQLFDKLTDLETISERSAYLLENQKYAIESAIEDYISSL